MHPTPHAGDLLDHVTRLCATAARVADVLPAFADAILSATGFDMLSVILYDADREFVRMAGSFPPGAEPWEGRRVADEYGTNIVLGFPNGIEYATAGNAAEGVASLARQGVRRAWTTPLMVAGTSYGVLTVGSRRPETFDPELVELLRLCGRQLAPVAREEALLATAAYDQARNELLRLLAGAPREENLDRLLRAALPALRIAIPFDSIFAVAVDANGCPRTLLNEPGSELHEAAAWEVLEVAGAAPIGARDAAVRDLGGSWAATLRTLGIQRVATAALGAGELNGVIAFGRRTRAPFSQADLELLALVAGLLGSVLANHARAEEMRLGGARSACLAELAVLVTAGKPVETLFEAAMPGLEAALVFDYVSLLAEGENGALRRVGSRPQFVSANGTTVSFRDSQIGDILALGSSVHQFRTSDVRGMAPERLATHGIERVLAAVLMQDGEPLGVLTFGRTSGERFPASDLAFVEVLATLLAQAVGNSKKLRTLERDARRSQILSDLAFLLNNREPIDLFFSALQDRLPLALQFDYLALSVVTDDGERLRIVGSLAEGTLQGDEVPLPVNSHNLFEGEIARQFTPRPGIDRGQDRFLALGLGRVITVILRDGSTPLGFMNIGRIGTDPFSRDETDFAGLLGTLLSQSLAWRRKDLLEEEQRGSLEQTARLTALGELVSGIAHELNNPLTSVIGFADLLATDLAGTGHGGDIEVIRKEALRARDIVRDLLFIARPGTGERTVIQFGDVISHVERLRGRVWDQQGLDVHVSIPARVLRVVGNEQQLTQVLLNLVLNAEDAVAAVPNPRLWIGLEEAGDQVVLVVRDNGAGMDEQTARRVFEPFFSTKRGRGNGLGLSISYSIAAAHGGELTVRSERGRGTLFSLALPRAEAVTLPLPAYVPTPHTGRARVLVIDDEPSIRALSLRLLAQLGHDGVAAATTGEAIEAALEHDFDLIVCDYRLGADRADSIVSVLRERRPELLSRFVIATGATTEIAVQDLVEREGLALLAKPYGGAQLRELLATRLKSEAA